MFLSPSLWSDPIPGFEKWGRPVEPVRLEGEVRFPWRGGMHPWPDALIGTEAALIAVESKRFEPFLEKPKVEFSDAFWRDVWGAEMGHYQAVRDALRGGKLVFRHLNAAQLVKHAFGLRTTAHKYEQPKHPVLVYVYAEPAKAPDGWRPDSWQRHQGASC